MMQNQGGNVYRLVQRLLCVFARVRFIYDINHASLTERKVSKFFAKKNLRKSRLFSQK